MKTLIKKISKKHDKKKDNYYYVIYFDYLDKEYFTYLNNFSLQYWKNKGLKSLKIGMKINVFRVKDTKYFKIVGFEE